MNDNFDAHSDDELQVLANEYKIQAEKCYAEAHKWSKRGGGYSELLRRVSLVRMQRRFVEQKPSNTRNTV